MADDSRRKLHRATIVYWVLLFYIIAAIIWWAFSLLQQNDEIYDLKKWALQSASVTEKPLIAQEIERQRQRNIYK